MQDIAGCRLIVQDVVEQESIVEGLSNLFDHVTIINRCERPTHGYRAVHIIITWSGKMIEIQVRTQLQHLWAELSEKFSDVADPSIKYGGGKEKIRELLTKTSNLIGDMESLEKQLADMQARQTRLPQTIVPESMRQRLRAAAESAASENRDLADMLRNVLSQIPLVEDW
jgi:ppGpp synthetase/RelA/SpoT-type nucleotidyltranferase